VGKWGRGSGELKEVGKDEGFIKEFCGVCKTLLGE